MNVRTRAVFDTAFHRSMPDVASLYAIPTRLAKKHGIRRFGFHETSPPLSDGKGCPLIEQKPAAGKSRDHAPGKRLLRHCIAKGKSIDYTMGFNHLKG